MEKGEEREVRINGERYKSRRGRQTTKITKPSAKISVWVWFMMIVL
jgi:hypothetical protein